jgi:hypothetical protein
VDESSARLTVSDPHLCWIDELSAERQAARHRWCRRVRPKIAPASTKRLKRRIALA